jgi:ribosome-binding protein aMBF1 (putative translation factor)
MSRVAAMKISDMKTANHVLEQQLQDPSFREEWDRTALAREVSTRVAAYRAQRGLSQAALARELGVSQPLIARLEAGEHEPTIATLSRLSRHLGLEFHLHITPQSTKLSA